MMNLPLSRWQIRQREHHITPICAIIPRVWELEPGCDWFPNVSYFHFSFTCVGNYWASVTLAAKLLPLIKLTDECGAVCVRVIEMKPKWALDVLLSDEEPKQFLITRMLGVLKNPRLHGISFIGHEINTNKSIDGIWVCVCGDYQILCFQNGYQELATFLCCAMSIELKLQSDYRYLWTVTKSTTSCFYPFYNLSEMNTVGIRRNWLKSFLKKVKGQELASYRLLSLS